MLRPVPPLPILQNQEYEHPRDLAACCGSCRNVSCLFTFPNGTTSLFLVCSPLNAHLGPEPRAGDRQSPGQCWFGGCVCLWSYALSVHPGHPPGHQPPSPASVPSSPGHPGSQSAPATTAAALPWAPCWSARPSAARRSMRLSAPRSVPASSHGGMACGARRGPVRRDQTGGVPRSLCRPHHPKSPSPRISALATSHPTSSHIAAGPHTDTCKHAVLLTHEHRPSAAHTHHSMPARTPHVITGQSTCASVDSCDCGNTSRTRISRRIWDYF